MSDYAVIVIIGAVGVVLSVIGLAFIVLQMKEARRESVISVKQEVEKLRAAIEGRR